MGCAKISMALVMQKLFIGRLFEYTSYILALFTAAWTVSGIFVIAFQCHLPTPWDLTRASECIDTIAFGNYLASTNIVTEILLVLVPLMVWIQKSPVGNRLYVSAVFWSRLRYDHTLHMPSKSLLILSVSSQQLVRNYTFSMPPQRPHQSQTAGPLQSACKSPKHFPSSVRACQVYTHSLPKT